MCETPTKFRVLCSQEQHIKFRVFLSPLPPNLARHGAGFIVDSMNGSSALYPRANLFHRHRLHPVAWLTTSPALALAVRLATSTTTRAPLRSSLSLGSYLDSGLKPSLAIFSTLPFLPSPRPRHLEPYRNRLPLAQEIQPHSPGLVFQLTWRFSMI